MASSEQKLAAELRSGLVKGGSVGARAVLSKTCGGEDMQAALKLFLLNKTFRAARWETSVDPTTAREKMWARLTADAAQFASSYTIEGLDVDADTWWNHGQKTADSKRAQQQQPQALQLQQQPQAFQLQQQPSAGPLLGLHAAPVYVPPPAIEFPGATAGVMGSLSTSLSLTPANTAGGFKYVEQLKSLQRTLGARGATFPAERVRNASASEI